MKDMIIKLVIIVWIDVMYKFLQFEDVNPPVTLGHSLHPETIFSGKQIQSSLFNNRPICMNPLLKLRLALSE